MNRTKITYTLYGVAFGLCFPLFAGILEMIIRDLPIAVSSVGAVHNSNKLLFMIDSAPVWLGLFALLGGISKAKADRLLDEFKYLAGILNQSDDKISETFKKSFQKIELSTGNIGETIVALQTGNTRLFENLESNKQATQTLDSSELELKQSINSLHKLNTHLQGRSRALSESIALFSENLGVLTENTHKISSIGREINMLAINSAIEANRTGNTGSGFRVIAENIKRLSEQIQRLNENAIKTTDAITAGLQNIQHSLGEQKEDLNELMCSVKNIEHSSDINRSNMLILVSNVEDSLSIRKVQEQQFENIMGESEQLLNANRNGFVNLKQVLDINAQWIEKLSAL